jgi:hypothetical protein
VAPRFRPRLEALEGRWLPSTLTVTNNLDSGPGSLRVEIAAANSGDKIVFAPSLDGKTITLLGGELLINKGLTIQGPGAGQLTVSGNNHSRVFEVNATQPVFLSGLTISYGNRVSAGGSLAGGGILNDTTLTISGCTISYNGADKGGGIANGGTLTISGCTISHNAAIYGAGSDNYGTLTVSGSDILHNRAAYGGGIYNGTLLGPLTVSQCTLDFNSASFNGGGIYNSASPRGATISQCTLYYNQSLDYGGGIYNRGRLTVSGCTLSENSAYALYGYSAGGGIYNALKITLTNCTLSSNWTNGAGGGLFVDQNSTATLTNCTLSGNTSRGPGGGIFVNNPYFLTSLNLTNTIVAGNTAGTFGADIGGPVATADHNLVGNATGSSGIVNGVNGNIVGGNGNPVINADLGPLQNNGGPTYTMALLAGSPAIGNADNALAPATDQRGVTRSDVAGEVTDIGAFELTGTGSASTTTFSLTTLGTASGAAIPVNTVAVAEVTSGKVANPHAQAGGVPFPYGDSAVTGTSDVVLRMTRRNSGNQKTTTVDDLFLRLDEAPEMTDIGAIEL